MFGQPSMTTKNLTKTNREKTLPTKSKRYCDINKK